MRYTHTPGPWTFQAREHLPHTVRAEDGREIAAVYDPAGNAAVIAQAPAMLELLQQIAPHIRRWTYDTHPQDELLDIDARLCRLLNLAEGEPPRPQVNAGEEPDPASVRVCCEECGSEDLEHLVWVHSNTDRISSLDESSEGYYCPECEEHERGAVEVGGPNDPRTKKKAKARSPQ